MESKASREDQKTTKTNRYTFITAIFGVSTVMLYNGIQRKILWQGIHKHTIAAIIGAYAGTRYGRWVDYQAAKRDYILDDYMRRHPEDFKTAPVKLVGERVDKWVPIR